MAEAANNFAMLVTGQLYLGPLVVEGAGPTLSQGTRASQLPVDSDMNFMEFLPNGHGSRAFWLFLPCEATLKFTILLPRERHVT